MPVLPLRVRVVTSFDGSKRAGGVGFESTLEISYMK